MALVLTVLAMPEPVWLYFPGWAFWVCAVAIATAFVLLPKASAPVGVFHAQVDEQGRWIWLSDLHNRMGEPHNQLTHHCRGLPFGLCLAFRTPVAGNQYLWVFKGECSEQDYRRLYRVAMRVQH